MDPLIPTRRPDVGLINKRTSACYQVGFAVPVDHRAKIKENANDKQMLESCQRVEKKTVEHNWFGLVCFVFCGISTFIGYLTPTPFLYK